MEPRVLIRKDPVRWGILSTANIGVRAVAPAIQSSTNGKLVAVGSRNAQHAAELYAFAPGARIYDGYQAIIDDPAIEAVYIPLPNSLHAEWSMKALEADKHVLCEKPLAITREEGEEMVDMARSHDVFLMEAFMYRFHPQIVWVLEQVQAGLIGPVRLVRASFSYDVRSHPQSIRLNPELAGGALVDAGSFAINMLRALYGHAPRSVVARSHITGPTSVDLATHAVLDYGDGCFGMLDASLCLPPRQGMEIIGELGTITVPVPFTPGNYDMTVFVTKDGKMTEQQFAGIDSYKLEIEHFAQCIRSRQEPRLSMNETLENLATIEAIYTSAGLDWPIL